MDDWTSWPWFEILALLSLWNISLLLSKIRDDTFALRYLWGERGPNPGEMHDTLGTTLVWKLGIAVNRLDEIKVQIERLREEV